MNSPPLPIHVYFALLPGSLVLDWAGPAEALRIANQLLRAQGQPERFVQHFTSPRPEAVTSVGAMLTGLEPLPATLPQPAWVVLVGLPGQAIAVDSSEARDLLHWLRGLRWPRAGWSWSPSARARCWQRTPGCWPAGAPPRTTSTWVSWPWWTRTATWCPTASSCTMARCTAAPG